MIELPKLQDSVPITDADGKPSLAFHRWWQTIAQTLEGQFNTINGELEGLITAAQTTADTAQTAADTAQTVADAVKITDKIGGSSVIPALVLSASDAGTDATITIAANTRLYGDSTQLPVAGGTITGLAYSTIYGIYYDDPTCADTTPTYQATLTLSNALNNFVAGRHFVGNVTTPAHGGGSVTGGYTPGGSDPGDKNQYSSI